MIPEGLEWKSVDDILDDVASVGFNFIRMGYAIQMIDEIYSRNGTDVSLLTSLTTALGPTNGTRVAQAMLTHNPSWTPATTRFEIWSDIARAALARGIFIHPDVHVGKAQWCCSHADGNAWFEDVSFPVSHWLRGLQYVAHWARAHENVVSMSLRNEPRASWAGTTDLYYNWATLTGNMSAGADAIHAANPDLLITWSGMQYDQDLSALTSGANLLTAPCYKCTAIRDARRRDPLIFDLAAHAWRDKVVWELHLYASSEDLDVGTCDVIEAELYRNGFNALGITPNARGCGITEDCASAATRLTPVIFSEFGHAQDRGLYEDLLQECIRGFVLRNRVSWMMWSLAGSYRIREGTQGLVDAWGLTSPDWSGWNSPETVEGYWKPWVKGMNVTRKG